MNCELCKKKVGQEGVIIKTKGVTGKVEYHLECFDEMYFNWCSNKKRKTKGVR